MIESILNIKEYNQGNLIVIENNSSYTIELCAKPVNNKRKIIALTIIPPGTNITIDLMTKFNLSNYYFRFI